MAREMKNSGIPWIGEIPLNWNTIRIKNLCVFNPNPKPIDFERVGYAPMNTIRNGRIDASEIEVKNLSSGLTYFEDGDIVMAKVTPCFENGNIAIASGLKNGCAYGSSELFVFRSTNISTPFLFYALQNETFKSLCVSTMTGTGGLKRISAPFVANSFLPVPPSKEQQSIANFLDEKCSEIDELISLQEKMIDELKSYKQSVITEAVTKGLDRNVKMKDSGVDWIGEIPEHWDKRQFKWLFSIKKDIAGKLGYDVLSVTQKGIKIKDLTKNEGQIAQDYSKYQLVNPNDFVMNHMDLLTGYVDCSKYIGVTSPDYRVFHAIDEQSISLRYYLCIFQLCYSCKIFYGLGQGVSGFGRWRLPAEQQKLFYLPYPPLAEQQEIADYLDTKCSEIDTLISIKQQKIDELKEYKKSLIYEYVTGKKEVV